MAFNPANYPSNWTELRANTLERAGHSCQLCGVKNHSIGARDKNGRWHDEESIKTLRMEDIERRFGGVPKPIRIVLTCHHICFEKSCGDINHLVAVCQRCHLNQERVYREIQKQVKDRWMEWQQSLTPSG